MPNIPELKIGNTIYGLHDKRVDDLKSAIKEDEAFIADIQNYIGKGASKTKTFDHTTAVFPEKTYVLFGIKSGAKVTVQLTDSDNTGVGFYIYGRYSGTNNFVNLGRSTKAGGSPDIFTANGDIDAIGFYKENLVSGELTANIEVEYENEFILDETKRQIQEIKDNTPISNYRNTIEGNKIVISDAVDNTPICIVGGMSQSGSGIPTPNNERPVTGLSGIKYFLAHSKNLLAITSETKTEAGVTFTVHKDIAGRVIDITANGTAQRAIYYAVNENVNNLEEGEQYILTGSPEGSTLYSSYTLYVNNGENHFDIGNGVGFEANGNVIAVRILVVSGASLNNVVFRPMLRISTEINDDFEPADVETYETQFLSNLILYGGTFNTRNGIATVTHDKILISDLDTDQIVLDGSSGNNMRAKLHLGFVPYSIEKAMSNKMNYKVDYYNQNSYEFYNSSDGDAIIFIPSEYGQTPTDVKNHLASLNVYFVGKLITPYEAQFTDYVANSCLKYGKNYIRNGSESALTINYALDPHLINQSGYNDDERDCSYKEYEKLSTIKRWLPYSVRSTDYSSETKNGTMQPRLNLLWMSDNHVGLHFKNINSKNIQDAFDFAEQSKSFVDDMGLDVSIKAVINCGDVMDDQSDKQEAESLMNKLFSVAKKHSIPMLFSKGNHDNEAFTDDDWGQLWLDYAEQTYGIVRQAKASGSKSTWHYYDIPSHKVRIIVADAQDIDRSVVDSKGRLIYSGTKAWYISQEQLKWFADTALNFDDKDEKDWGVIVAIHQGVEWSTLLDPPYESGIQKLADLCKAFNEQTTYTNNYVYPTDSFYNISINADFTRYSSVENPPHMICWLLGHHHIDMHKIINGIHMIYITDMACMEQYSDPALARIPGTATENAFDIISIDTLARKIRLIRYGAGLNGYGYGGDRFIPEGLSY